MYVRFIFCRFYSFIIPNVYADAGAQPNDPESNAVDEDISDDDDQQVKKKAKKEKVGFRDRKVIIQIYLCNVQVQTQSNLSCFITLHFLYPFLL